MTGARGGATRREAASWSSGADGDPVNAALAAFGREVGRKLGRGGQPEDQLRGPLERLLGRLSRHVGLPDTVASVKLASKICAPGPIMRSMWEMRGSATLS